MHKKGLSDYILSVGRIILPIVACLGALFLPWWAVGIVLLMYFFVAKHSVFMFAVALLSGLLFDVLFWSGRGGFFSFFTHTIVFLILAGIVYGIRKYTRVFE